MKPKIKVAAARKLQPQKLSKGDLSDIMREARRIEAASKKPGSRTGLIGDNGLKVLHYLLYAYAAKGWACFPTYKHIANTLNIARSTVIEAIKRLKRVGFLSWFQRRNGKRQGSNLFQVHKAPWSARLLPVLKRCRQKTAALVTSAVAAVSGGISSGSGQQTQGAAASLKLCGVASPHSVFDESGAPEKPARTVYSEGSCNPTRLERAFAQWGPKVAARNAT